MPYQPPTETESTIGIAELIIGFIVCIICIGYIINVFL